MWGLKKYLKIYKESMRVDVASVAAYRANFLLGIIISLISNVLYPLVTLLIYRTGATYNGWGMYEVFLIQSIFTLSNGISGMFFSGILWRTMDNVQSGTLEVVLIKPVNCMGFLLASSFNIGNIGVILGGVIIFVISIINIGGITFVMCIQSLLFFIMGILIMFGFQIIMAATSFKWVANSRIPELYGSIMDFGRYPLTIFNRIIVGITSFIVPVAMIGYFPASALLGRTEWWMYVAIIPCVLFAGLGVIIYQYNVRLYEGVGG